MRDTLGATPRPSCRKRSQLAHQAHAGCGKILFLRATLSTACPSSTPTQELQLARMELLSGQPTEATPGSVKQVGRRIMSLLFHSPMRITEQLLAGTG